MNSKIKKIAIFLFFFSTISLVIQFAQAKTTYILDFQTEGQNTYYIMKYPSWFDSCEYSDLKKSSYIIWHEKCVFEKQPLPNVITIQYIKWISPDDEIKKYYGYTKFDSVGTVTEHFFDVNGKEITQEKWNSEGLARIQNDLNNKKNNWSSITINTNSIARKYKNKLPEGKPVGMSIGFGLSGIELPSLVPQTEDKQLIIVLKVDKNGIVKVNEEYVWKNPYHSNSGYVP